MGVIGHPAPMAKYELIPPPVDPLESYLRETNTGVPIQWRGNHIGVCKARMVTARARGVIGDPTPN